MRRYSKEEKQKIVKKYMKGQSVLEISAQTNIPESTIYDWIKAAKNVSVNGFQKKIKIQEKQIVRLETMIKIIHNTEFFKNIPLSEKLSIVDDLYCVYGINVTCDALDVSHGTFHNHQKRGKGNNWLHEKRKLELLPEIIKIDNEFNHILGADKITAELNNRGFKTSKKTVLKIMNEENIKSIRTQASTYKKSNQKARHTNVLNRNFRMEKPNQAWVSDVTYLQIDDKNKNTFYLCAIMDLFSRKIIAHSVGVSNSKQLINATLKKAVSEREVAHGLVFHSDRGANYTSRSFAKLLEEYEITQSFSKAGCPYDNSVIESFFQNFKTECFYRYKIKSKKNLINIVNEYVNFYNIKRTHSYLNYVSPNQFEENFYSNKV